MAQLKNLWSLVQALGKSEKRYFRLRSRAQRKGASQLEQLFDWLGNEPEAPHALPASLQGLAKTLPTLSSRLLEGIQNALVDQHRNKTQESRLNQALERIALLYKKKQWDLAQWQLTKEKRVALTYSYLPQYLALLGLERKVLLSQFPKDSRARMADLRQQELAALELLSQQAELSHLDYTVRQRIRQRLDAGEGQVRAELRALAQRDIVRQGLDSPDFLSFSYASNILGNHCNLEKDFGRAIAVYARVFEAWKERPRWIQERSFFFLSLFSNYQIALLYGQKDTQVLESALQFIRDIQLSDAAVQLHFQNVAYQSSLVIYMNRGDFDAAAALSLEISDWLTQNAANLSPNVHLTFRYNGAVIHFMRKDFPEAQRNVTQILDLPGKEARRDIREFARLFQVLLALEMGDTDYAGYLLHAAYQYLLRTHYPPFFKVLVEHLRVLMKGGEAGERRAAHIAFRQQLAELRTAAEAAAPFGRSEMEIWARARVEGIPLREAFRRHAAGE